jgi:Tol biopolymer transport system component
LEGLAIAGRDANGNPRLVTARRNAQAANVWKIPLRGPGDAGAPPQPLPLRNDSGNPDYSPDNKRLVFVSDRTGKQELWTANADGSNLQHPGLGLDHVGTPRWSPDSQHIAFFARRNPDSTPQIYVIDVNQEHPVAQQVTKGEGCLVPTWSRNGKFVYCSRTAGGGEVTLYRVPIENGAAASGEMEKWFEGKEAWESGDGRILFIKNSRPGLFVRSLTGDPTANPEDRLVTDIQGPIGYLAPVAEGVYYTGRDSFGYTAIRFFDYARKKSVVVASREITGPVNSLAVSPDGRSLLFTRLGDAEFDLTLISF